MDDLTIVIGSFIIAILIAVGVPAYYSVKRARFKEEAVYALSASAAVIGKRMQVSGSEMATSTDYFVTFDIEGLGRVEFNVAGNISGLLVEGDRGTLRYLKDPLRFVDFTPAPRFQQVRQ